MPILTTATPTNGHASFNEGSKNISRTARGAFQPTTASVRETHYPFFHLINSCGQGESNNRYLDTY